MEFKCERCNPEHDYKTEYKLKRHKETPSHKRKFDEEFAAAEQAEKAAKYFEEKANIEAANVAKKAATKKAREHKEKARKANRGQRKDNEKRDRTNAKKMVDRRRKKQKQHKMQVDGDGTEEDALKALVRYHGSTNVAMLLHTDNERIKSNITSRKFVHVSPEVKAKIRKAWQEGEMATSRPHYSCATEDRTK